MENSIYSRYADSQDHLIISLNSQIESLIPLKDSYSSLQRYHIKLTSDFEPLLSEQVNTLSFRIITPMSTSPR